MDRFLVEYEVRPRGAIGIFEIKGRYVKAEVALDALGVARSEWNDAGFETRNPAGVWNAANQRVL